MLSKNDGKSIMKIFGSFAHVILMLVRKFRIMSSGKKFQQKNSLATVCPRSSFPLFVVSYLMKWVTSWTYSISDLKFLPDALRQRTKFTNNNDKVPRVTGWLSEVEPGWTDEALTNTVPLYS